MFVHGYKLKKPTDIVSACSNLGKVILECASSQTKDITIDLKYFLDMLDKDYALGIKVLFDIISSFISVRGHVAIVNFILNVESEKLINFYLEFLKEYSVFDADKEYCPRLIYVLDENTSDVNSKFYKVTKAVIDLSMEGYPINYFSNKKMLTYYQGKMILPINFNRMMLPYKNKEGEYQTLGRFDQGMVSVNLNQIGLSCSDDEEFFKLLDEKLDIAIEALMSKYFNLLGTDCNSNAVAFRYGAIMVCLNKNIDEYLKDNYSCLCLGLSGLYDLVTNYKKIDFYSEDSFKFITLVISYINKRIELLRKQTKIGFMVVLDDDYLANLNFLMKDKENLSYKGDLVYQNLPIVKDIDELRFQGIIQDLMKGNCVIRLDIENKDVDYLIKYIYENIFYVTLKTGNEIKEE